MMTDDEVNAIKSRSDAATSGPWILGDDEFIVSEGIDDIVAMARPLNNANANFIAESRTDIPRLLADREEMADEIKRLREFAQRMMGAVWDNGLWDDLDGGSVQDAAEQLGLIELRPCTQEQSIDGEAEHYFLKWAPKQTTVEL